MSFYDGPSWQGPGRQPSWEQPPTPSRSGANSSISREDSNAFSCQLEGKSSHLPTLSLCGWWQEFPFNLLPHEGKRRLRRLAKFPPEVDRAIDNLSKSGKMLSMPGRRESVPLAGAGRSFGEFSDNRIGGAPRHHSVDFDPMRAGSSSNLQSFYANQRYQPRHGDADQMQQAKRRMAAQRERELRNYHQEQQYNRSVMAEISSQGKSERSNSPSIMNEEDRRELIARQHRALYGGDNFYEGNGNKSGEDGQVSKPANQAAPTGGRGPSPMAFNSFGGQEPSQPSNNEDSINKGPSPKPSGTRSRSNSNSSPASTSNPQNYTLFEASNNAQQSSRTSNSSPGGSPPNQGKAGAPAPIGTRPGNPALNKRGTPPAASPLSFGFAPNENNTQGERAASSASNPSASAKENGASGMSWGTGSGVWGKGALGGVQASVWG